jgi:hypothetical protein
MTTPPPAHRPLLQRQRFLALLIAAGLGATLLIAYLLWAARQDARLSAQVTALNYARTLEVRMDATFRRADSVLHTLTQVTPPDAMAPQGELRHATRLNADLDSMLREFDELMALRLIDARGDQRYVSSAATTPNANYADRSFFQAYRDDPNADLLFSEVVTGRVSQRPTMVITRPLRDAQGRFYGAVLAPMDLGFFQQQFRKLDIGQNGAVFLRRMGEGQLVLRWPQIDAEVNKPMPANQPILLAVTAGKEESVNEYVAFTDGVPRISGTIVVKGYPFFLTVALSERDVLASWRRLALLTGLTWTALLVLMSVLMRRLWRTDRERRSLEAQLRESQRIESIGTLAGGIAHDFNNILAAILGNVALARDDIGPDHPAQASLEQIRKASARPRPGAADPRVWAAPAALAGGPATATARQGDGRTAALDAAGVGHAGLRGDGRALERRGRRNADPAGPDEPVHERLACPARPSGAHPGRAGVAHRRGTDLARGQGTRRGPLRQAVGAGHRHRHGRRHPGAHLRALLHDQAHRPGHGAGAVGGARHRDRTPGRDPRRQRARSGHDREPVPAAHRPRTGAATRPARDAGPRRGLGATRALCRRR